MEATFKIVCRLYKIKELWVQYPQIKQAADALEALSKELDAVHYDLAEAQDDNWMLGIDAALAMKEQEATIARLHDLVAKFQSGGTSTLYAEGHME